jgi:hypothetical protein
MITWTPILLILVPMILAVAFIYAWMYLRKRSNVKFPFADAVPRNPGEALAEKITELTFDFAVFFPMAALIPIYSYAVFLQIGADRQQPPSLIIVVPLFIFAAFGTAWFLIKLLRTMKELHLYRIGYAGEVAVGGALNQLMLQGYRVFHDIKGDKEFNVDHLLIGPSGVFAVETKTKTKKKEIKGKQTHKVMYDGKSLYFPDRPDSPHRKFLEQSKRNAKWVSKWLTEATGHPVKAQPVLVLPGWFIVIKKPGDVRVLNHNQLQALTRVANRPPLNKSEIDRLAYQIQQRCQNSKIVPKVFSDSVAQST